MPAIVGAVLVVIAFVAVNFLSPSETSYRFAINLTMPGAAEGKYPNGLPYAPTDLRSASVLDEVYKRNQLQRFNIDRRTFASMITVSAYSPIVDGLVERYRNQSKNRDLTVEERRALDDLFASNMRRATSDGAIVSFLVPDNLRVSREVGLKVVSDVPTVWSDIFVNLLGVGERPLARSEGVLIGSEYVESLDYPLAYDYATAALDRLIGRITDVLNQLGAKSALLPSRNVTAYDLLVEAQRIQDIDVGRVLSPIISSGLSRDKQLTVLSYEHLIEDYRNREALAARRANLFGEIVAEGTAADMAPTPSATPSPGGQFPLGQVPSAVTSIPQFGDAFIDRIVGLTLSGSGAEFRQDLLRQKLEFAQSAALMAKERTETELRLAAIRSFDANDPAMATLPKRFSETLATMVAQLNSLWSDTNEILDSIGSRNLNGDKDVYSSLPITDQVVRTAFWRSPYILIAAAGAILFFGLAGLALRALRNLISAPSRG